MLVGSVVTEAPTGGLEVEPEVFDADRIRADEVVFEAAGRTKYTTLALAPDGSVAAYTEIAIPSYDPGRGYQWGTLVLRAHRGHRLGLAPRWRTCRLQRERPDRAALLHLERRGQHPHGRGQRWRSASGRSGGWGSSRSSCRPAAVATPTTV